MKFGDIFHNKINLKYLFSYDVINISMASPFLTKFKKNSCATVYSFVSAYIRTLIFWNTAIYYSNKLL